MRINTNNNTTHHTNIQSRSKQSFKGWLKYTNSKGVQKMINTDTIQNLEAKKLTYVLKNDAFTGKYKFDIVKLILKDDKRVIASEIGEKTKTSNWRKNGIIDSSSNNSNSISFFIEEGRKTSLEQSSKDMKSEVLDKIDLVVSNFDDFVKSFQKAINEGFATVKSNALPDDGKLADNFSSYTRKNIPITYKTTYESRFFPGYGIENVETSCIDKIPSKKIIEEKMKSFNEPLKKEYNKALDISYKIDAPLDNEYCYKRIEVLEL